MSSVAKLTRFAGRMVRLLLTNPCRLSHVLGQAASAAEEVSNPALDLLRLPSVSLEDLLPESETDGRGILGLMPKTGASVSVIEYVALILLLKRCGARNVFEFGTYKGVSITQLALNVPEGGRILTLDLPEDDPRSAFAITDPQDIVIAREKGKGAMVPKDVRGRIQFLKQDSATFDVEPYEGQMDFVFVDGAHNADYVRNDSEKAWRLLRPGGIVAWHDCRVADPDVVRYLLDSSFHPVRILPTTLAFATKPQNA
jgi:predicted O-methyltransferase YrrM